MHGKRFVGLSMGGMDIPERESDALLCGAMFTFCCQFTKLQTSPLKCCVK